MPFYEESYTYGAGLRNNLKTNKLYNEEDAMFSTGGGYNPTNLAVKASLQEVFDAFMEPVTEELRLYSTELKDNDTE